MASPLPQQTLAYLSLAAPSANHCCQEGRARLLITCQWAWSKHAHPGAKRVSHKSWKSQQAPRRWDILEVWKGHSHSRVQLTGSKVRGSLGGALGPPPIHLPSALMNTTLGEHGHTISVRAVCSCFLTPTAELRGCNSSMDHLACKA